MPARDAPGEPEEIVSSLDHDRGLEPEGRSAEDADSTLRWGASPADDRACDWCAHPLLQHRQTPTGRREVLTCTHDGCGCHFERANALR